MIKNLSRFLNPEIYSKRRTRRVMRKIKLKLGDIISYLRRGEQKYIFLHSHMRARSTLLSLLICNSKEVYGYHESHLKYYSYSDLSKLRWRLIEIKMKNRLTFIPKFCFDNINHNVDEIKAEIFNNKNIFHVFLLRKPLDTIKSNLVKFKNKTSETSNYYVNRVDKLKSIGELALRSPNGFIFIDSDELIDKTEDSLNKISDYLGLKKKLSQNYKSDEASENNGTKGYENYAVKGKIVKKVRDYDIKIPSNIIKKCDKTYKFTYDFLLKNSKL